MLKDILNQILQVVVNALVSIIGIIISIIGAYIINFIKLKNDELIKNIGISKYSEYKSIALDIWNIVDEYFRTNTGLTNSINDKIKMFNNALQRKCPELTQQDIDFLRQSVAGEINKGKNIISSSSSSTLNN